MPDLIVKDMEMPYSCMCCPLNYGEKRIEYGWTICCRYSNGVVRPDPAEPFSRLLTCGLLEIQTHGDLIDRDAIKYVTLYGAVLGTTEPIINEQPVIVPAERRET